MTPVPSPPQVVVTLAGELEMTVLHPGSAPDTGPAEAIVQLQGELDLANAEVLAAVLAEQLGLGCDTIRLDVSRLSFLDCAGLRVIVDGHNRCLANRGLLLLTGVGGRVARLLEITGLDEALFTTEGIDVPRASQRPSLFASHLS